MHALITNIQGYSIHDGLGIRTVVFFKGCNLACQWCANPECISHDVQIGFISNLCTHCGKCFIVCPQDAIDLDESKHRIDYRSCNACGRCVDACYYKALVQYGSKMSVDDVFDAVRKDKIFYDTSGGGVTVSGGEPLLHAAFVKKLFALCKEEGINTCVETSGFVNSIDLVSVLPLTDYILFDIKHMNPDIHLKYTGRSNELILKNAKLAAEKGANITFRFPLIPSVNDSKENIIATAEFIKIILNNPKVQLMPYHRMGDGKYKALKMTNQLRDLLVMEERKLEAVKQTFIDVGVECAISK